MVPASKYYGFHPAEKSGVVFGLEKIAEIQSEIEVLYQEHFAETEKLYLEEECNMDYERYKASEAANQFVVFTARADGKLVGYLQYYVFRDMHTQAFFQAREDAFFVTKDYRGRRIAPNLLAFAEDALKHLGCKYVGMSNKAPVGGPDIGPFLEREGYKSVATFFFKKLE
jgi:GNAT superfamily N-acetyltransferase